MHTAGPLVPVRLWRSFLQPSILTFPNSQLLSTQKGVATQNGNLRNRLFLAFPGLAKASQQPASPGSGQMLRKCMLRFQPCRGAAGPGQSTLSSPTKTLVLSLLSWGSQAAGPLDPWVP